jgi:c(7)-type cytochrome triheme protein
MQEMRTAQTASERIVRRNVPRRIIFALPALLLIGAVGLFDSRQTSAILSKLDSPPPSIPAPDYSKFSHSTPKEHADLTARANCAGCHRRGSSSMEPKFPAHKDCTGCHLIQFTNATTSENQICTICHSRDSLNSANAATKSFPRLRSFTAAFDHAQHLRGIESARPAGGCAVCHTRALRGVALTIPSRLGAHQTCFECHSPGKSASDSSSCGSCHRLGRYSPTSVTAPSYRWGFSHADHSRRERLTCESCHNVLARGLPEARQVSSITAALHRSSGRARSCLTCHNSQRAFGDAKPEFNNCKRCHKGATFKS